MPAELADTVAEYRNTLIEALADVDEELGDKYLMEEEITREDIVRGIQKGVRERTLFPILLGAGADNIGVQPLLDLIVESVPSPLEREAVTGKHPDSGAEEKRQTTVDAPFSAFVFKSTADPYVGKLNFFRVWSGMLRADPA